MSAAANASISIQPQPTWSDEDRARAEHYALIARLFHAAPDAALLAALAQAGRTLGGEGGELPRAWAALGAAAQTMPLQAVAEEFDALFVSVGKPEVMCNGSWYLTGFLIPEGMAHGEQAVAAVSAGPIDLVLMDCHMPVMDGFQATERIRGLDGDVSMTPIVALTASAMPDELEACKRAGMNDCLTKPVSLQALKSLLHRIEHYRGIFEGAA